MSEKEHTKFHDIFREISGNLGGINERLNSIDSHIRELKEVAKEVESLKNDWSYVKGKIAVVGVLAGTVTTLVISWIKEKIGIL
jgi:archaellum component FlaC